MKKLTTKMEILTRIIKPEKGDYILSFEDLECSPCNIIVGHHGTTFLGKDYDSLKEYLVFSKQLGYYVLKGTPDAKTAHLYGSGFFPYHNIKYNYEASGNLEKFQALVSAPEKLTKFKFAKDFPYTFGIEYETSGGFIPQEKLFSSGLIPLRDGSISGIEYSTVILKGNEGLSKIKEHCRLLKEYTIFNNNCSMHLHFGNFPLEPKKIFALYVCCHLFQDIIGNYVPLWAFNTEKWKSSGKSYCKKLPFLPNFDEFYNYFVGYPYFGDLYQSHPRDLSHERKWQIPGRYYWVNFINLLCYNNPKTVEFRFMRPTYCPKKTIAWIKVFNTLLKAVERNSDVFVRKSVLARENYLYNNALQEEPFLRLIKSIISKEEYLEMYKALTQLRELAALQYSQGDFIGSTYYLDNLFFS